MYLMCRWARVSRSGYYRWRNQGLSETQKCRYKVIILITYFFHESEQTYEYRRIHAALAERGVHASLDLVRQLMHLASPAPHRHPGSRSSPPPRSGEKEFHRHQTRAEMGRRYHLHPHLGRIHLSGNCDGLLPKIKIIGYAIARNMHTQLVTEALHMAVRNCPVTRGETVFRFDAWFTLTSQLNCAEVMSTYGGLFRNQFLRNISPYQPRVARGLTVLLISLMTSAPRRVEPSRVTTMPQQIQSTPSCKKEVVNREIYPTQKYPIKDAAAWIELRFNQKLLHSTLGTAHPTTSTKNGVIVRI